MLFRDVFVLMLATLGGLMALRNPFTGLLTFSWLAYMRAQDLCWGFAKTMRFSYFVAITMMIGWIVSVEGRRPFLRWDMRTFLMVLLILSTTVSLGMAQNQDEYVITRYFEFLKLVTIALFTTGQVDSRKRLKLLLWTIALSLGFYGVKNGLFGILSGGSAINRGPGGMLEDNNDFALALVMNMPLLLYLGFLEEKKWIHRACAIATGLTIITVFLTHSRGGFLSMMTVLGVFFMRSKKKTMTLGLLGLIAVAFFTLAPEHVVERLVSIKDTGDSSRHARLTAWSIALRMIGAFPVWGVGLRNFQDHYHEFSVGLVPDESTFRFVAHNSYLQIWAEGGTIAFALYLGLILSCFLVLRRLRKRALEVPGGDWVFNYCRMFEATLAGFMTGSFFLNRGHFDLIYHVFGIITAFQILAFRWLSQPVGEREGDRFVSDELQPLVMGPIDTALTTAREWKPKRPRWGR
jgi:probable O-glycosylation ligase (exosortase A-associated)